MTRDPGGKRAVPQPGIRAYFDGTCPACPEPIVRGESRVFAHRGEWLHVGCASGGDDE